MYTEEELKRAIELARGIKSKYSPMFTVDDIAGLTETDTYGWEEALTSEAIIDLIKQSRNKMNPKAEFAVQMLKQYAHENQVSARSTSDLSPLEQWLILRLYTSQSEKESNKSFLGA